MRGNCGPHVWPRPLCKRSRILPTRCIAEALEAARARVQQELRDASDEGIGPRLLAAVIAPDGGHSEPVGDSKSSPNVKPIDLKDELEHFADYMG